MNTKYAINPNQSVSRPKKENTRRTRVQREAGVPLKRKSARASHCAILLKKLDVRGVVFTNIL